MSRKYEIRYTTEDGYYRISATRPVEAFHTGHVLKLLANEIKPSQKLVRIDSIEPVDEFSLHLNLRIDPL